MIGKVNRLAKVAASASLVAGAILATAGPAAAAGPNASDGAAATGLISIDPVAQATTGNSPVTVATVNVAGLLTTGIITDKANRVSASSDIANVAATLATGTGLTADAVSSSCTFDPNSGTVTGTSGITNGAVSLVGLPAITLDANAAPNTTVNVPGVATITLNRQTTAADGTLTVDAIYVNLLNGTQTLTIGTSTCNAARVAPVPVLPGMALPIGLGALGVLGLGGVGFVVARRRRVAVTAAA
jgi:hypothetical protein